MPRATYRLGAMRFAAHRPAAAALPTALAACLALAGLGVACTVEAPSAPAASTPDGGAPPGGGPGSRDPSDPTDPPAPTADAACAAWAAATCGKQTECQPRGLELLYGDAATCEARATLWCDRVTASGIAATAIAACTDAYGARACDDFYVVDEACSFRGAAPAGAGCSLGAECASGSCSATGAVCGTCRDLAAEGQACGDGVPCEQELYCLDRVCRAPVARGDACVPTSRTALCAIGLRCVDGRCADPLPPGSACAGREAACDGICDAGRCRQLALVDAGARCDGANLALCREGVCREGVCLANAADGQACDTTRGAFCTWPAVCDGGVCTLPAPGTCP